MKDRVEKSYKLAKEAYAEIGVDTDATIEKLKDISISLHCCRVHIGLDFFDASINRIAAWVIGTRCTIKALLQAILEPTVLLKSFENDGNFTERLAVAEELKTMPLGAVWDCYCLKSDVPVASDWLKEVKDYEACITGKRI